MKEPWEDRLLKIPWIKGLYNPELAMNPDYIGDKELKELAEYIRSTIQAEKEAWIKKLFTAMEIEGTEYLAVTKKELLSELAQEEK